ncbi:MAG: glycoside hydrolase family 5 protein [Lachnospiraceae bacterium]|nr:glycoside hydrolase family 5 protein [Lachnospiraceae bacterium]
MRSFLKKFFCFAIAVSVLMNLNLPQINRCEAFAASETEHFDLSDSSLWRIGRYMTSGNYSSWPSFICVKETFECEENACITVKCGKSRRMLFCIFDEKGNSLGTPQLTDGKSMELPEGSESFKISMYNPSDYQLGYSGWKDKMFADGREYSFDYTYESPDEENGKTDSENASEDYNEEVKEPENTTSDNTVSDNKQDDGNKDSENDVITASDFIDKTNVGWNLGNSLDSHYGNPDGTARLSQETIWGNPYVTQGLIDYVKEQGFDIIRIPVSWYYHTGTDENGNIHINEEWLARVKQVVDYAYNDDMYIILDSHHDQPIFYVGTSDEKFAEVQSNVKLIWGQIAEYFKDYDNHLVFESFNEVDNVARSWNYSDTAAEQMNTMNQLFVDTVRATGANNSERILMVPTLLDGYTSDFLNAFELPSDIVDDRILVTIHNYATQFDQDVEPTLEDLDDFSKSVAAPIVIGECGSNASYEPAEYRITNASNYFARAKAHGFRCIWWDNGSNFRLINRKTLDLKDAGLMNAVINPEEYTMADKATYSSYNDFFYGTINQSTGLPKADKYWGTILLDKNGQQALEVPADKKYMTLLLNVRGDAVKQRIHYVYFFDSVGNLVGKTNSGTGFMSKTVSVPDNSAYVRVGINNSYSATKVTKYQEMLENGDISLTIGFVE